MAFFALAALAIVAFRRPFDLVGGACLAACIAFVVLGCVGILKPDFAAAKRGSAPAGSHGGATTAAGDGPDEGEDDADEDEAPVGDPSAEESRLLEATIAALEAVGALDPGEVDATALWTAAQRLDPGRTIGIHEALGAFSALHDSGRARIGRLTFVPSHTEYDGDLIAEIAASALSSLGHPLAPADIAVALPAGGGEGTATLAFAVGGRPATVTCHYRWKYPPDDLLPALARFRSEEDPRDLVGADPGDQTMITAAIRAGTLAELNRRLPAEHDLFSYEA